MIYRISGTKHIPKGKAATFGYKPYETKDLEKVVKYVNTHAIIPCVVKNGHRLTDNVIEILPWIRLDIDKKGEIQKIEKRLKKNNIMYIKKPSTSNAKNPWKWHIFIPVTNVSQNYDEYKLQYFAFLTDMGITLSDKSLASVVQNTNPMGESGIALTEVVKGNVWKAPKVKAPKKQKRKKVDYEPAQKKDAKELLKKLDPDCSYDDWYKIGMALHTEFGDDGFKLFNKWSKKSDKYSGISYMNKKWNNFDAHNKGAITMGSLIHMVHGEKKPEDNFGDASKQAKKVKKKKPKKPKKKKKDPNFNSRQVPGVLTKKLIKQRGQQLALFPGVVVDRMHTFIYGAAGMGKTTLFGWISVNILKEYPKSDVIFWSFDTTQDHEQCIFEYAQDQGVGKRFQMSVDSTGDDYEEWARNCIEEEADLTGLVVVIDTFKNITKNVNDKNANKEAMHRIKDILRLGATVVSLGHSNKDGIKHSGTAEIEQDSDAILVMNRAVNTDTGEVVISIEKGGRVRFNSPGVSFKMKPEGVDYDYHASTLATLEKMDTVVDLKTKADEEEKKKKAEKLRETRKDAQRIKDQPLIEQVREAIIFLTEHKKQIPSALALTKLLHKRHSFNHKRTERLLSSYHEMEWTRVPYIRENIKTTQIYQLL